MIKCNKCDKTFENDEALTRILITEQEDGTEIGESYNGQDFDEGGTQEVINGCPDCLTDAYLMDI